MALWLAAPMAALAQTTDLGRATLDELMNIRVVSASRKEQRAEDVPAAVFVLTRDDIRRSGITTLPELFRLVPGMQVARVNANRWAVSVRGFNGHFSNKLLVLIDGRSVYNRAFSGVHWDAQDLLVSDIARIEVIRGPGGASWGANAVNGIVNIITRSAAETQGTVIEASLGSFDRDRVSARYGGSAGNAAYRAFAQWTDVRDSNLAGQGANDRWSSLTGGARLDWTHGNDEVMAQTKFLAGTARPLWIELQSVLPNVPVFTAGKSDLDEVMLQARWTRRRADSSVFTAQAFHASSYRDSLLWNRERTTDAEVQYETRLYSTHAIVMGGGIRKAAFAARPTFTLQVEDDSNLVVSAFAQDEVRLGKAVSVTIGSKIEHDTTAGWGLLPSGRVLWRLSTNQRVWAAVSKARRTPSTTERTMRFNVSARPGPFLPILVGYVGNPNAVSEALVETEAGYRTRIGSSAELDVTVFRGHYDHLTTTEPLTPQVEATPGPPHMFAGQEFANLLSATTEGIEVSAHWSPFRVWRFDGSYSALRVSPHPDAATRDPLAAGRDGNAPTHQWQVRASAWLTTRLEIGGGIYYVGRLEQLAVPSYTRTDARAEFALTRQLSLIGVGQNLFDRTHREFQTISPIATEVPRSVRADLRWRF